MPVDGKAGLSSVRLQVESATHHQFHALTSTSSRSQHEGAMSPTIALALQFTTMLDCT